MSKKYPSISDMNKADRLACDEIDGANLRRKCGCMRHTAYGDSCGQYHVWLDSKGKQCTHNWVAR